VIERLESAIGDDEFEYQGGAYLRILNLDEGPDTLAVGLGICTEFGASPEQRWSVVCAAPRVFRLESETFELVQLAEAHVVLAPHKDQRVSVYFRGAAERPKELVADLLAAHASAAEGWFPFEAFLNTQVALPELLSSGYGCLATGPRSIVSAYSEALEQHDLQPNAVEEGGPFRWLNGEWVPENSKLQALLLGPSFVVAERFEELGPL